MILPFLSTTVILFLSLHEFLIDSIWKLPVKWLWTKGWHYSDVLWSKVSDKFQVEEVEYFLIGVAVTSILCIIVACLLKKIMDERFLLVRCSSKIDPRDYEKLKQEWTKKELAKLAKDPRFVEYCQNNKESNYRQQLHDDIDAGQD